MSTKCEYYVDMGEHNKPLCKKRNYRPSDCESCPTYIKRLQEENAQLRELVHDMFGYVLFSCSECWLERSDNPKECGSDGCENKLVYRRMRELGIEVR